jgi:CRISPR-associated protein Cas2
MTRVLLIYDITNDRARTKVADACLDYGLDRVQFSAFSGELNYNHQEELFLRIQSLIKDCGGKVCMLPIGAKEWGKRLEMEFEDA